MIARAGIAAAAMVLTGCAWRAVPPARLDGPVAVVVVAADSRLPRSLAALRERIAQRLVGELGWQVAPAAAARLELALIGDQVDRAATDRDGLPVRWTVGLRLAATLVSEHGRHRAEFTGTAGSGSLADEDAALGVASDSLADQVAAWLATGPWRQPPG